MSDVVRVDKPKQSSPTDNTRNPHVFEIVMGSTTYYIGEDPTCGGQKENVMVSAESGVGLEQGLVWENAIRQALMPVTPQPSGENDPSKQPLPNSSVN